MGLLTEMLKEEFSKPLNETSIFSYNAIPMYYDQYSLKRQLNKELGFSGKYNPKSRNFKEQTYHCVNIQFDDADCYYTGADGWTHNYPVKLGKSTYKEIKDAVISMYKKEGPKLAKLGYEVPANCK